MSENTAVIAPDFSALVDAVVGKAKEETSQLHSMAKELKASSGSIEAVREWLNASEDEEIIKERELIAQFVAKLQERKSALETKAKIAMGVNDTDRVALQASFNEKKKTVRSLLMQAKGTLTLMGQDASELDEALDNLPGASTSKSGRSPEELDAIRAWARENGHEVADRGRIAAAIITAYEAKDKAVETDGE